MLLDEPALLGQIVAAVSRAVPADLPVSAKMRLGNQDGSRAVQAALAIAEAGACELVVHARTKLQGYKPPAYWQQIRAIASQSAFEARPPGGLGGVDHRSAVGVAAMSGTRPCPGLAMRKINKPAPECD